MSKDPVLADFVSDYFDMAEKYMIEFVDNAYDRSYFGESKPLLIESLDGNDLANNFNYLLSMLMIAYHDPTFTKFNDELILEFYDAYNINCIKKTFLCWKCDITPIINRFTSINNSDRTGIGFMAIEGSVSPFKINNK